MAIGPRFPIENGVAMHRVPREWEHVVCICPNDEGTFTCDRWDKDEDNCVYSHCLKCKKLKRFYSTYCYECKKFYLMVFRHPVWSPQNNRCFECCNKVDNYFSPNARIVPPLDMYRYPAVLKTPEEIAAELDSLLSAEVDLDF